MSWPFFHINNYKALFQVTAYFFMVPQFIETFSYLFLSFFSVFHFSNNDKNIS